MDTPAQPRQPRSGRLALRAALLVAALGALALAACDVGVLEDRGHPQSDIQYTPPEDAGGDADDDAGDADGDAGDAGDADLPPGAQGAILGVPETERWTLPGLRGEVHVVRTEANVPHIYAADPLDLYYVEGFVMARDRYTEFELARRLGQGRVSELLGQDGLATDMESRGLGRAWIAQRILDNLSDDQGALLDAYAAGINAYIQAVADGALPAPSEFGLIGPLLGGQPADFMQPVTRDDIAGFVAVIVSQLGFEAFEVQLDAVARALPSLHADDPDVPLADLRRAGALDDIFHTVGPVYPVSSAAGWGIEGASSKPAPRPRWGSGLTPQAAPLPRPVLDRLTQRLDRVESRMRRSREEGYGSNAWAVGRDGTAGGGSLLAGDGHLSLGIPPIFYQMGLDTSVFGGGDITQLGLVFPGFPLMTVGTNGRVAWSQTYLYADVTDWYREELRLGDDGLPSDSLFQGQWRPLQRTDETYVVAQVDFLGSEGRTETWARWTTFDGRWIVAIEGTPVDPDNPPDPGAPVVTMLGDLIVPGDLDGDGVVTAVSFDYTGFDVSDIFRVVDQFHKVDTVDAWREQTKGLVAYAQNIVASDDQGNITYTGYNGIPCRRYLDRDPDTNAFLPGADPRFLLDGTTYGGFTVPLGDDGNVDEQAGDADPYRCVIPFDSFPQSVNPPRGYVQTANNDPGNITTDGSLFDDPWYMGYAWAAGYRADTIATTLGDHVANADADIDAMAALQGDIRSRLGADFGPLLVGVIDQARAYADANPDTLDPWQARMADAYQARQAPIDEAAGRLQAWLDRGALARSGVATVYQTPTDDDRADAVATMIFNAWFRAWFDGIFADERLGDIWLGNGNANRLRALTAIVEGRGPNNPRGLASWNPDTEESAFFDVLDTPETERSDEVALAALTAALDLLAAPQIDKGVGGFGTDDQDQWLWGLRHLVVFESIIAGVVEGNDAISLIAGPLSITPQVLPIADDIGGADDPRRGLPWFPRDGDRFAVDAANPNWTGPDYFYRNGPVMRMVIHLNDGQVTGQNIIPGGQSGITSSPHFADQAALWLANDTVPMRFYAEDVAAGATGREVFTGDGGGE